MLEIVQKLFALEPETFSEHWSGEGGKMLFCNTQLIPCVLFHGQRLPSNHCFSSVDAGRIIDYVSSHPDASGARLDASLAVYLVPYGNHSHPTLQRESNRMARDVMSVWGMVFTNKHAAKYILLGTLNEKEMDQAAIVKRAQSIEKRLKPIFAELYPDTRLADTTNSNIEGLLHQMAAMIHYRLQEYKIPVDFEAMIELDEVAAIKHRMVAVPMAEATIRKGRTLTMKESNQVMAVAAAAHP